MNRLPYRFAIASIVAALAGCNGTMGLGGSSQFSCPLTGGVTCETVGNVYRMSRSGSLPSKPAAEAPATPSGTGESAPTPYTPPAELPARPIAVAASTTNAPTSPSRAAAAPLPIRSQPRILRGWIVPYEDADGDLVGDAFVFIPVDGGRWMVEHARQRIRDTYAPARPAVAAGVPAATVAGASKATAPTPPAVSAGGSFPPADGTGADLNTFTSATQSITGAKPAFAGGSSK